MNLPFVLTLEKWLEPSLGAHAKASLTIELLAIMLSILVAIIGFVIAYGRYARHEAWTERLSSSVSSLEPAATRRWYLDDFYYAFIILPLRDLSRWLATSVDQRFIDGTVDGVASGTGSRS